VVFKCGLGRVGTLRSVVTFLLLFGSVVLLTPRVFGSQSLTLSWNPSPDTNVVGYNLYYGTCSKDYTYKLCVGDTTVATVNGLQEGYIYYFAVTAVDCVGLESEPSNEISYTVPGLSLASSLLCTNGLPPCIHVTAMGSLPSQWTLQQSTDLQSWQTVQCGTNCPVDATLDTGTVNFRFFRLVTP